MTGVASVDRAYRGVRAANLRPDAPADLELAANPPLPPTRMTPPWHSPQGYVIPEKDSAVTRVWEGAGFLQAYVVRQGHGQEGRA